jgi:adenosyl cobinamide kinase/adenosyl cobinamide phosphate guanylyltransferase
LIFGGAYQGKLGYALERSGLARDDVFFCSDTDVNMPSGKTIVYGIDKWFLALVKAGKDVPKAVGRFMETNLQTDADPQTLVVCNDVSCGVVPVDRDQRKWREETGRAMGRLAQYSSEVVRLFCGIPTKIK